MLVHCFDFIIITAGKIICQQYMFEAAVVSVKQALMLTLAIASSYSVESKGIAKVGGNDSDRYYR